MNVLVSCDPAESPQELERHVFAHSWPPATKFTVMAVVLPLPAPMPDLADQLESQATGLVEKLVSCLQLRGLEATGVVRHGYPRLVVITEAAEIAADLIIVGSPRAARGIHPPTGTVARTVLRFAHCSVEIARPVTLPHLAEPRGLRVLVPTDGSSYSHAAARWIGGHTWPDDSVFKVVSIAEYAPYVGGYYPGFLEPTAMEALESDSIEHAKIAVGQSVRILEEARLNVLDDGKTRVGSPNELVLEEASRWNADLIVLGSHGKRGLWQFLIGSVSEYVAMHAACSVHIQRTADEL